MSSMQLFNIHIVSYSDKQKSMRKCPTTTDDFSGGAAAVELFIIFPSLSRALGGDSVGGGVYPSLL